MEKASVSDYKRQAHNMAEARRRHMRIFLEQTLYEETGWKAGECQQWAHEQMDDFDLLIRHFVRSRLNG